MNLNDADQARVATALRFYIERCNWAPQDKEKAEYQRLLNEARDWTEYRDK